MKEEIILYGIFNKIWFSLWDPQGNITILCPSGLLRKKNLNPEHLQVIMVHCSMVEWILAQIAIVQSLVENKKQERCFTAVGRGNIWILAYRVCRGELPAMVTKYLHNHCSGERGDFGYAVQMSICAGPVFTLTPCSCTTLRRAWWDAACWGEQTQARPNSSPVLCLLHQARCSLSTSGLFRLNWEVNVEKAVCLGVFDYLFSCWSQRRSHGWAGYPVAMQSAE